MRTLLLPWVALSALLAPTAAALAAPGSTEVVVGLGYPPSEREPVSFRFGVRGDYVFVGGDAAALSVLVPVEVDVRGQDGFGFNTKTGYVEIAPSLRFALLPEGVISPYVDAGFGPAVRFSRTETPFGNADDSAVGWAVRTTLGARIGGREPGQTAVLLEPFGWRQTQFGDTEKTRLTSHIGLAWSF